MSLSLRYVARSDVGLIREGNEDSGYAGPSLLAVADGMGGHAAGEVASSVAVTTLATLEEDVPSTELVETLAAAVIQANDAISDMVEKHPQLDGMGTTLTAMLWSGRRLGLVHVGDSRAYLLREGELQQITHDHTFVQQLQDEGRITAAEAAVHPQRSLLLRALDGRSNPEPDLSVREVHRGDRYLLCSDGLSGVVSDEGLIEALSIADLDEAADTLIQMALRGGGPDNITAILADVVDVDAGVIDTPLVVGAAAERHKPSDVTSTSEIDMSGVEDLDADAAPKVTRRLGALWPRFLVVGVIVAVLLGAWGGYAWSQRQYYIGADSGRVTIYKGLSQKFIGISLSDIHERQDIDLTDLPPFDRQEVQDTIFSGSLDEARKVVDRLRALATACQEARADAERAAEREARAKADPNASPTRSPKATASPEDTASPGDGTSPGEDATPEDGASPDPSAVPESSPDPSASPIPTGSASPTAADGRTPSPTPPPASAEVDEACGEDSAMPTPTPDPDGSAEPTASPDVDADPSPGTEGDLGPDPNVDPGPPPSPIPGPGADTTTAAGGPGS